MRLTLPFFLYKKYMNIYMLSGIWGVSSSSSFSIFRNVQSTIVVNHDTQARYTHEYFSSSTLLYPPPTLFLLRKKQESMIGSYLASFSSTSKPGLPFPDFPTPLTPPARPPLPQSSLMATPAAQISNQATLTLETAASSILKPRAHRLTGML